MPFTPLDRFIGASDALIKFDAHYILLRDEQIDEGLKFRECTMIMNVFKGDFFSWPTFRTSFTLGEYYFFMRNICPSLFEFLLRSNNHKNYKPFKVVRLRIDNKKSTDKVH